jgi:hypothetical protein
MQEIIKQLQDKISSESTPTMPIETTYYVSGLADALEIVQNRVKDKLKVGQEYYVLMPVGNTHGRPTYKNEFRPLKLKLYQIKILQNRNDIFCFALNKDEIPDWYKGSLTIQFSNPNTLKLRVFKTFEEAEKNKEIKLWTFRKPYI